MERGFGYHYPPGMRGAYEEELELQCVNPDCESFRDTHGVAATRELGASYLRHEDELTCPDCGWARESDDLDRFPIVENADGRDVLVDLTEDEVVLTGPHSQLQQARYGYVYSRAMKEVRIAYQTMPEDQADLFAEQRLRGLRR